MRYFVLFIALMSILRYNKNRMATERNQNNKTSSHLPPRETWLFTPGRDNKFPTPTTDEGLVDIEQVLTLAKTTIAPDFEWGVDDVIDIHHFYWEHRKYPIEPEAAVNPHDFCELPSNKAYLPRKLHAWIHTITLPPERPSLEVMHDEIIAQRSLHSLFSSARESTRISRMKNVPEDTVAEVNRRHLEKFQSKLRPLTK